MALTKGESTQLIAAVTEYWHGMVANKADETLANVIPDEALVDTNSLVTKFFNLPHYKEIFQ